MNTSDQIIMFVIVAVVFTAIYVAGHMLHKKMRRKINDKFSKKYAERQNANNPPVETKLADMYRQDGDTQNKK